MRKLLLPAALVAGLTIAGCGDDSTPNEATASQPVSQATTAETTTATAESAARGKSLKIVRSRFGRVVADASGEALYLFTREKGKKSKCYGACAKAWPPMLTRGKPRARRGVTKSKLGTTKRRDGKRQVTYNGHPLYYYQDDAPGRIGCQDVVGFGGTWLVVNPKGKAIT